MKISPTTNTKVTTATQPGNMSGNQPENSANNKIAYPREANAKAIAYSSRVIEIPPSFLLPVSILNSYRANPPQNKVKDLLNEWILEEPSLNYRQKLQYFVGYLIGVVPLHLPF